MTRARPAATQDHKSYEALSWQRTTAGRATRRTSEISHAQAAQGTQTNLTADPTHRRTGKTKVTTTQGCVGGFGWLLGSSVCVIRVPVCNRLARVCPGSPLVSFYWYCGSFRARCPDSSLVQRVTCSFLYDLV